MLKITTTRSEKDSLTVYLWGDLMDEYIPELQTILNPDTAPQIILDMSHVLCVSRSAMEYLCSVKSRIVVQNIPSWLLLWIEQEFRCGSSSRNSRTDS